MANYALDPLATGTTIMVVDDEDALRPLLRRGLEAWGHTVLTARSGPEALRVCDGHALIDVLLTDVIMPNMNGRELSERLTARYPALLTLFMSGYSNNILGQRGMLPMEAELLQKPFTPDTAGQKIRHLLDGAR